MTSGCKIYRAILGLLVAVLSGHLYAQTPPGGKSLCEITGAGVMEPIPDREGHAIQVSTGTRRTEGGVLDGAIMTQNTIWEVDKGNSAVLSGDGVTRKAGGIAAYRVTAGTRTLVMKDGKIAGWTASGKGVYTMATGTTAPLAGKTFSWTAHPTGFNQYVIDTVVE